MQSQVPQWVEHVGGLIGLLVILGVGLVISLVICYLLYEALKRVPSQFRQMDPPMVWLLMIPCFNLVWNFFVFPKISRSYKAYFEAAGNTEVGDCAEKLGLIYAICAVCSIIPCVGAIAGLAGLVLLIIYLVQIYGLKAKIQPEAVGSGRDEMAGPQE